MKSTAVIFALLITAGLQAGGRSIEAIASYSLTSAVKTFADPVYLGEHDYVSGGAQQAGLKILFENIFALPFVLGYKALSVSPATESAQGNRYTMHGYNSHYVHASTYVDSGIFRWHFGFAALFTPGRRSHYDEATGGVVSQPAVDTALSQSYPTGGFTLFPNAPIRLSMIFLPADADLLYGWLRVQAEFSTGQHTVAASLEVLNHASFGKGLPNFAQPPCAFVLGYSLHLEKIRLHSRIGFVLNSTQEFNGGRVSATDRLLFEIGAGYNFSL